MGCADVRLLKTIGSVDFTGQERAALNKLTMPAHAHPSPQHQLTAVGIHRRLRVVRLAVLRRPQFSWTRIKGQSDVEGGGAWLGRGE